MGWFDDDEEESENDHQPSCTTHETTTGLSVGSGVSQPRSLAGVPPVSYTRLGLLTYDEIGGSHRTRHEPVDTDPTKVDTSHGSHDLDCNTEIDEPRLGAEDNDESTNDFDNDDDPLDAYMKSLDDTQHKTLSHSTEKQHIEDDWDDTFDEGLPSGGVCHDSPSSTDATKVMKNVWNQSTNAMHAHFVPAMSNATQIRAMPPCESLRTSDDIVTPWESFPKAFWPMENTQADVTRQWREEHGVQCNVACDPLQNFADLSKLSLVNDNDHDKNSQLIRRTDTIIPALLDAIQSANLLSPTVVQAQTLPVVLAGRDALVTAATGQGKTLAYLWPLVLHVAHQRPLAVIPANARGRQSGAPETGPLALVLVPTRELAQQVAKQAKPMVRAVGLRYKVVIGGQGRYLLQQELKQSGGVEVVVATPGRLLDCVGANTSLANDGVMSQKRGLNLQRVTFVVLDEADKMLQMGFENQVRQILDRIRPDRQSMMLSATMGKRVENTASDWLQNNYVRIAVGRTGAASLNVTQDVVMLPHNEAKRSYLRKMIPACAALGRTLVFVATRESCEQLASELLAAFRQGPEPGSSAVTISTLHGDKSQADRTAALRAFSRGSVNVLIATDVASRGLDVPHVMTVINYDPAKNLDIHVHRIGRAGRLDRKLEMELAGSAYTLLLSSSSKEVEFAHILRNSFAREGRPIPPSLSSLKERSGHKHSTSKTIGRHNASNQGETGNGGVSTRIQHSVPEVPLPGNLIFGNRSPVTSMLDVHSPSKAIGGAAYDHSFRSNASEDKTTSSAKRSRWK